VLEISEDTCNELVSLLQRSMQLQCTIQDGEAWLDCGDQTVGVLPGS